LLVAHDSGISEDLGDLPGIVARHLVRMEAVEGFKKCIALAQDDRPGQASLKSIEHELAEQLPIVVYRHPPFGVVVGDHLLIRG